MTSPMEMLEESPVARHGMDPSEHRKLFRHLPTGVVAITGVDEDGEELGMVVGTFQSLSVDPPLVMFSVDRSSSTWPRLRRLGTFSASVLGAEQESTCRALSRKGPRKLEDVARHNGPLGNPRLDGAVIWLDCRVTNEVLVGDHFMVVGEVLDVTEGDGRALLFLGREFGRYEPLARTAVS